MVVEADQAISPVVKNVRMAMFIEHMRQNNLSYIVGTFVAWQMGLLDSVITYGSGICS
jgi:hypothetical protein